MLVDEALPGAGGAGVTGQGEVRLKAELADILAGGQWQRRLNLALVRTSAWESGAFEEDFKEDLGVVLHNGDMFNS